MQKNSITHLWSWLSGKKTYIIAAVASIYAWGVKNNVFQHDALVDTLLASGGLAALRHGLVNSAKLALLQVLAGNVPSLPPTSVPPGPAPSFTPPAPPTTVAPPAPPASVPAPPATVSVAAKVAALVVSVGLGVMLVGAVAGCKTPSLEVGGQYAPLPVVSTNDIGVVSTNQVAPDVALFEVDSAFKMAYETVDTVFNLERENRALLWGVSHDIKHSLDKIRPDAAQAAKSYATARAAYLANPTMVNMSSMQAALTKIQALSSSATAVVSNLQTNGLVLKQ